MYRQVFLSNALKWAQNLRIFNNISTKFCQANVRSREFIRNTSKRNITRINNCRTNRGSYKGKTFIYCGVISSIIRIFEPNYLDEDEMPKIILTLKRAVYLIQKEEYNKAEQMLHLALKIAQEMRDEKGITYTYDLMANLAYDLEDYAKAEKLFLTVMQRMLSTGTPQNSPEIIHMSLKLARGYEKTGQQSKAEIGYEFCKKHLKEYIDNNTDDEDILMLWGMTLDYYSQLLSTQKKYDEAFNNLIEAYNVCVKVNGEENEKAITLLNDLALLCSKKGDTDKALKYLNDAIELGKHLPETSDLGALYINLGYVYMQKGLYSNAQTSCEEGRKISISRNLEESVADANTCLKELEKSMS